MVHARPHFYFSYLFLFLFPLSYFHTPSYLHDNVFYFHNIFCILPFFSFPGTPTSIWTFLIYQTDHGNILFPGLPHYNLNLPNCFPHFWYRKCDYNHPMSHLWISKIQFKLFHMRWNILWHHVISSHQLYFPITSHISHIFSGLMLFSSLPSKVCLICLHLFSKALMKDPLWRFPDF